MIGMAQSEEVKDPATTGKGKGKLKLIIIAVVALLLAVGLSVGATWFLMHKSESKVDPAAAASA
ncbi:Flagellar basal body-associated protein FliL, partial [Pseudomonas syringae pv. coryli]